jgi:hypothetical protein
MGLINLEPTLRDGEEIRWRRPAALALDDGTVAGTLFATTLAIVFMPNRLNRRRNLVAHRIPLENVAALAIQEPTRALREAGALRQAGALRHRLRIETNVGDAYLFVLNHPDEAATELQALLAGRNAS